MKRRRRSLRRRSPRALGSQGAEVSELFAGGAAAERLVAALATTSGPGSVLNNLNEWTEFGRATSDPVDFGGEARFIHAPRASSKMHPAMPPLPTVDALVPRRLARPAGLGSRIEQGPVAGVPDARAGGLNRIEAAADRPARTTSNRVSVSRPVSQPLRGFLEAMQQRARRLAPGLEETAGRRRDSRIADPIVGSVGPPTAGGSRIGIEPADPHSGPPDWTYDESTAAEPDSPQDRRGGRRRGGRRGGLRRSAAARVGDALVDDLGPDDPGEPKRRTGAGSVGQRKSEEQWNSLSRQQARTSEQLNEVVKKLEGGARF